MKNILLFIFSVNLFFGIFAKAKAENVLYCESNIATSFFYMNEVWKQKKIELKRFTVKFDKEYSTLLMPYPVTIYDCKPSIYATLIGYNTIVCLDKSNRGDDFIYDTKTMNFIHTIPARGLEQDGYVPENTSKFYAGKCKKF